MSENRLAGKVVLITGGAGGIGKVVTSALLNEGAQVAVVDVADAPTAGKAGLAITADISNVAACSGAVAQCLDRFGRLDVLINNAAVGMGALRASHMTEPVGLDEINSDHWRLFIDVNLSGVFHMTKAAMPHLLAAGHGRVINVTTSFFTMLRQGFVPYGPTKAAVEAMSSSWSGEFRDRNVTVNVVVPGGPTDTPMVPPESGYDRRDLISPSAMAPPIVWLACDDSDHVTGQRFVAAHWNETLADTAAAEIAGAPIGWPDLADNPVWPGKKPTW